MCRCHQKWGLSADFLFDWGYYLNITISGTVPIKRQKVTLLLSTKAGQ